MRDIPWITARPEPQAGASVWSVDLAAPAWIHDTSIALLSPDERVRADRFLRAEDRLRFIASHAALRRLLGSSLGASPAALTFATLVYGKPVLAGAFAGRMDFSLSHSGSRALIGLANHPIGVDVEHIRPIPDHLRIAQSHFHPDEVAALAALPPAAREGGFYACWTRKEAFVKAVGAGLSMPLARFAVSLPPAPPALLSCEDDAYAPKDWSLDHLEPADGFIGAIAIADPDAAYARFQLAPDASERF